MKAPSERVPCPCTHCEISRWAQGLFVVQEGDLPSLLARLQLEAKRALESTNAEA